MFADDSELSSFFSRFIPAYQPFTGNYSFTPWFRLIARHLLFPWWDEMLARSRDEGWNPDNGEGSVRASVLEGSSKVGEIIKMV